MTAAHDFGPFPELMVAPIAKLTVESKYQRDTSSRRSQALIEKIAAEFRWARFGVVFGVRNVKGGWDIVDGQHRVEAARRRGITQVPLVELPEASVKEAAAAFVALNRDRVSVTAMQLHRATLAAGEELALTAERICAAVGVSICRFPVAMARLKPGETMAVGSIRRLITLRGAEATREILRQVVAAYGLEPGAINAKTIRAIANPESAAVRPSPVLPIKAASGGGQAKIGQPAAKTLGVGTVTPVAVREAKARDLLRRGNSIHDVARDCNLSEKRCAELAGRRVAE